MSSIRASDRFRRHYHSKFGVSREVVAAVVRRATGSSAVTLSRIVRGQDNEVYQAATDDGAQVIVRINHFGEDDGFAGEAWAMDQARLVGVPVPEVLLIGRLNDEDAQHPVMVQAMAPGQVLAERAQLTAVERHRALVRAGAVLARMNSVQVPGLWRPGPDGAWPDRDWETLMTDWVDDREAERDLVCSMGFAAAEFARMIALLRTYVRDFPCGQPVLCHGDFTPEHIFIDEHQHVCGVIDFGMYCGGPPISDLAYLRYALPESDLAAILAGYGGNTLHREDASWHQLELHALGLAIGNLASEITIGNTAAARQSANSLATILRRLTD